jgi:hypothetical protein
MRNGSASAPRATARGGALHPYPAGVGTAEERHVARDQALALHRRGKLEQSFDEYLAELWAK